MIFKRSRLVLQIFILAACALALAVPNAAPRAGADSTEQGKFVLHKFEQAIGEETYAITREGDSLTAQIKFTFTDRGRAVPLEASLRSAADLTPEQFEIKGNTSRLTTIDDEVDVQGGKVRLRNREKWSDAPKPNIFFTISGYAPATMQMLMVRYWAAHGSPAELETLPSGRVKIEPRGKDSIRVGDKDETLERYTVEGLIWGRETLWFDANRNLVAAVTTDAEFDHFEAVRDGYESALGKFVGIAGADGMAALLELAKNLPGNRSETLAIVGGTLVDGTGAPALPDATVVISQGHILAVGPHAKVKIPGGAKKIDARGKTILPGLWDMHAHFEQVEWGPIYLAVGATTVRDCGNEFEFIKAVRDAIAGGNGLGPRLLLAGVVDGTGPLALGVERVDTPEEAKLWVDRYHDAGFQQMKIYSSVRLDELKIVAEEAHRLGMTVIGHVPEGLNAYQTIGAGQDQINHVQYVADIMRPPLPADAKRIDQLKADAEVDTNSAEAQKAIAFLVDHGTVVDPTLAIYEFETANTKKPTASFEPGVTKVAPELAQPLIDVEPPSQQSRLFQKSFETDVQIVGALHRAGVPIVAGTDQTVPGYSLYREIELYVQAGFTPMEAIQAATIVPARVMGLDKELGTIELGKQADLIILNANPLESIHNIRTVDSVITGGTMYHCAELWQSVGFKP